MLTTIMIACERCCEIGMPRAIGASDGKVVVRFTAESINLTLMTAVRVIFIGLVAANPITDTL